MNSIIRFNKEVIRFNERKLLNLINEITRFNERRRINYSLNHEVFKVKVSSSERRCSLRSCCRNRLFLR